MCYDLTRDSRVSDDLAIVERRLLLYRSFPSSRKAMVGQPHRLWWGLSQFELSAHSLHDAVNDSICFFCCCAIVVLRIIQNVCEAALLTSLPLLGKDRLLFLLGANHFLD
jgi:hypothetical protein